jgi:hypothetical protein
MTIDRLIAQVKEKLKNEPLSSANTYYPLICEGETGWRILVLRPKTKSSTIYVLCEGILYGLQGNTVLYRTKNIKNGCLERCDDNYGWGYRSYDREHYIRFRRKQIPCEVIHRYTDTSWKRSYK